MLKYAVRECPGLAFGLGCWILVRSFTPLVAVIIVGHLIHSVTVLLQSRSGPPSLRPLLGDLVAFTVLYTAGVVNSSFQGALQAGFRARMTGWMQQTLMREALASPGIAHLEDPEVADELRGTRRAFTTFNPADAPVMFAFAWSIKLQAAAACVYIGTFRWWLGLVLFCSWVAIRKPAWNALGEAIRATAPDAGEVRRASYYSSLATTAMPAKEIRVFGLSSWVIDRLRGHMDRAVETGNDAWGRITKRLSFLSLPIWATVAFEVSFFSYYAMKGTLSVGQLTVLLNMLAISRNLGSLTSPESALARMMQTFPDVDALQQRLAVHSIRMVGQAVPGGGPHEIRFEHVSFRYPHSAELILDDFSLVIPKGRVLALVGANGAGKTTLVKLLARLYDVTSGTIYLDGVDIREFEPGALQRCFCPVFQEFSHYPESAEFNVALSPLGQRADPVLLERVSADAGVASVVGPLPQGWGTRLSSQFRDGVELSGGQWQRVALGRALYKARIAGGTLVLDEPTAWLDARAEAEFYDHFFAISGGLTAIVISHRFSTTRLADEICVIADGRVSERGTHTELFEQGGTYRRMYEAQAAFLTSTARGDEA